MLNNQKGFLLISVIFIMVLMAVSIFSINYYSITQVRMASNQIGSVQTRYDLNAIVQESVWELTKNFFWRTAETGEDYPGNAAYTRIVRNADNAPFTYPSDYSDAVTIQVTPKGSTQSLERSFRYYIKEFAGSNIDPDEPRGLYKDASGNIFIADGKNHKILRVDGSGIITTFAGTGDAGNTGDGAAATDARLNEPSDVYKDASGNVFIADTKNHKIRRVDGSGIITTVAGTGDAGDSGDWGFAISARLNQPLGIYCDSSYLYIADSKNHRIRSVKFTNQKIYPVAGTGIAGYSGDGGEAENCRLNEPHDIYKDSWGNLYIADTKNHRIRRVSAFSGNIYTVAGTGDAGDTGDGGDADEAELDEPYGVLRDSSFTVYIADTRNHKIRRVNIYGNISTFVGGEGDGDGGAATLARLDQPHGIFKDTSGNLYIADTRHHKIRKVDTSGTITPVAGTGNAGNAGNEGDAATDVELNEPRGVFKDGSGNLYIADTQNHKIRKVDVSGTITTVAGTGNAGNAGNEGDPAIAVELNEPRGIFKDGSGNLYIADTKNYKIRKVDASGTITTVAGTGDSGDDGDGGPATAARLKLPGDIFVDTNGNIFIVDLDASRIKVVNALDNKIYPLAGIYDDPGDTADLPAVEAKLEDPAGITMSSSTYGNKRIYISDMENHKIKVLMLKTVYGF